jgi:RES domain-containing protein
MILAPLPPLPTVAVASDWYRAVRPIHVPTALATAHTVWVPGRYNAGRPGRPGFPILYLAEDPITPLHEVGALVGSPLPGGVVLPVPGAVWTVVQVRVSLATVVDLTDPAVLSLLGTSVQELTGDWRGYAHRPPPAIAARFGRRSRPNNLVMPWQPRVSLRSFSRIRPDTRLSGTS